MLTFGGKFLYMYVLNYIHVSIYNLYKCFLTVECHTLYAILYTFKSIIVFLGKSAI